MNRETKKGAGAMLIVCVTYAIVGIAVDRWWMWLLLLWCLILGVMDTGRDCDTRPYDSTELETRPYDPKYRDCLLLKDKPHWNCAAIPNELRSESESP
jgi:hypothetical protein